MDTTNTRMIVSSTNPHYLVSERAKRAFERYQQAIRDVLGDLKHDRLTLTESLARIKALGQAYGEEQAMIYQKEA